MPTKPKRRPRELRLDRYLEDTDEETRKRAWSGF